MSGIWVVLALVNLACLIDAVRQPPHKWAEADREKSFWVIMMIFAGPIADAIYLLTIRPRFAMGSTEDSPFLK